MERKKGQNLSTYLSVQKLRVKISEIVTLIPTH